jgi:hypothetical protein
MGVIVALGTGVAAADTFKMKDEHGRVQYSDRVPPDAVKGEIVELSKQGMTKKVIEAPPTPEQRRIAEERAELKRQADLAAQRQRAMDNALLASYSSEKDIEVAKRRNLALVGASILSAEARIKALEKRAAALDKERQFYEKKPVPDKLKREIAAVSSEIPKQHEIIAVKNQEALKIATKYDEQLEKFRGLKTKQAAEAATLKLQ